MYAGFKRELHLPGTDDDSPPYTKQSELMGILQLLDKPKNIIHIVWDGQINADEWLNQAHQTMAQPEWRAISRLIVDVHTASKNDSIGMKEMEAVAALFGMEAPAATKKRVAAIANHLFGRARTFSSLVSPFGVSMVVFNHLDTACAFLGLDPGSTEQILEQLRRRLRSEGLQ